MIIYRINSTNRVIQLLNSNKFLWSTDHYTPPPPPPPPLYYPHHDLPRWNVYFISPWLLLYYKSQQGRSYKFSLGCVCLVVWSGRWWGWYREDVFRQKGLYQPCPNTCWCRQLLVCADSLCFGAGEVCSHPVSLPVWRCP